MNISSKANSVKIDELEKSRKLVTPAKAGVHNLLEFVDSRLRGNDRNGAKRTFYEAIKTNKCYLYSILGFSVILILMFALNELCPFVITDNAIVAKVNNDPVYVREYMLKASQNRSKVYIYFKQTYGIDDNKTFWTDRYGGESPLEKLKEITLRKISEIKIAQSFAKQYEIIEDTSYTTFLKDLEDENRRRKFALANNEVIYGPEYYKEMDYFDYIYSNMVIELKRKLEEKEFTLSDFDYMQYYELHKDDSFKKADLKKIEKIVVTFSREQGEVTETKKQEAYFYIEKMKSRIDSGEAFEDVLKENAATQKDGGIQVFDEESIIMIQKSNPVLYQEAANLHKGEISGIFEANGAYYLIKCSDEKMAGYKPFEEVKELIKARLIHQRYMQMIEQKLKDAKVEVIDKVYGKLRFGH